MGYRGRGWNAKIIPGEVDVPWHDIEISHEVNCLYTRANPPKEHLLPYQKWVIPFLFRSKFSPTQTAILSLLNRPSIEEGHKVQWSELLIGCERCRSTTTLSMAVAVVKRPDYVSHYLTY